MVQRYETLYRHTIRLSPITYECMRPCRGIVYDYGLMLNDYAGQ